MKFKVGDTVITNQKSNSRYSFTNEKNEWIGNITHVDKYKFSARTISIKCPEKDIGVYMSLKEKFFDLYRKIEAREL